MTSGKHAIAFLGAAIVVAASFSAGSLTFGKARHPVFVHRAANLGDLRV